MESGPRAARDEVARLSCELDCLALDVTQRPRRKALLARPDKLEAALTAPVAPLNALYRGGVGS
eukprot:11613389-Alexandrium_andersonii.AAC.1